MIPNKLVSLALIDPPRNPMRIEMNDADLESLARDIAQKGLIHPLSVRRDGERYYVIAGHRRYMACKLIHADEVEVKDYTGSKLSDESIKFSENRRRAEVNPAEEANWLDDLQKSGDLTLEQLMQETGESESWINSRLALMRGDKRVFDLLFARRLNLAQATELNKFPDDFRLQYITQAVESGANAKQLHRWRHELKQMGLETMPGKPVDGSTQPAPVIPGAVIDACVLCHGNQANWDMTFVRVHQVCLNSVVKALDRRDEVTQL